MIQTRSQIGNELLGLGVGALLMVEGFAGKLQRGAVTADEAERIHAGCRRLSIAAAELLRIARDLAGDDR